eukprot:6824660-Heterocapsa_arctica.AAC.1
MLPMKRKGGTKRTKETVRRRAAHLLTRQPGCCPSVLLGPSSAAAPEGARLSAFGEPPSRACAP